MSAHFSKQLVKYAGSTGYGHWTNDVFPELVAGIDVRTKHEDFQGAGVIVTIVKTPTSGYAVRVCNQYAIGGQQHVVGTVNFVSLRDAVKHAYSAARLNFGKVVERKFAVDLVGANL